MAMYLMYGKYSSAALKDANAARTRQAAEAVKKYGGEIKAMYATLGEHDLVFVLTFPGNDEAMRASLALARMTGIAFSTAPAVTVEEFDKLMSGL